MEERKLWQTDDGRFYRTKQEAENHEKYERVIGMVSRRSPILRHKFVILDYLINCSREAKEILQEIESGNIYVPSGGMVE